VGCCGDGYQSSRRRLIQRAVMGVGVEVELREAQLKLADIRTTGDKRPRVNLTLVLPKSLAGNATADPINTGSAIRMSFLATHPPHRRARTLSSALQHRFQEFENVLN
jgi:hypothetical protein